MKGVPFHDAEARLSTSLIAVANALPPETVSLRELIRLMGEQGMLLICVFLSLPFLIPVSIPGVSTVFGLGIILIAVGITMNRVPWLPAKILDRPLTSAPLTQAIVKGAGLVARFEGLVRPRLAVLTGNAGLNLVHGLALVLAGILLMFPLGLVPFSNTLPALAILFLSLGMLERDGLCIIFGYLMNVATIIYFAILFAAAFMAGKGVLGFLG